MVSNNVLYMLVCFFYSLMMVMCLSCDVVVVVHMAMSKNKELFLTHVEQILEGVKQDRDRVRQ